MLRYILIFTSLISSIIVIGQNETSTTKKIDRVIELIDNQYVDSVDMPALIVEAIKAMTNKLDPHSKYLTAEESKKTNESLYGSFGGVGINYQILYDTMLVLSTVPGGPAQIGGILPGDKLILVEKDTVLGKQLSNKHLTNYLRGKIGTKVNLTIKRKGEPDLKTFEITRGAIPINTIDAAFMLNKDVGYIKINGFSFTTMNEFNLKAGLMKMQGMKHLVLDLRGNPGGLMIASINLADEFLEAGQLIVYTEGKHYKRENYNSTDRGEFSKGRLIVLVDELSASASEIFAGAIQDLDRGLIAGRRSYGKGLVGKSFILPDGSSIRLITGHYFTPSGRCIQKPFGENHEQYKNELAARLKHGEYLNPDSIKFPDSLKYTTSKGRTIYGGGGIMPDIFIPIDTTSPPPYYLKLNKSGVINAFAGAYFDKYLNSLQSNYKDVNDYKLRFKLDEKIFIELKDFALKYYKIEIGNDISKNDKNKIMQDFKAYLGRNLFENGALYQLNWNYDSMILTCLKIVNNKKEFTSRRIEN